MNQTHAQTSQAQNAPSAGVRRPYRRSMQNWWQRDAFFMSYMAREITSIGVWIYALILTVGVLRLSQGQTAWNAWLEALQSPWSILLHCILLICMVIHAHSWFVVMPKTMPMIFIGNERLKACTITKTGWFLSAIVTIFVLALAWGLK